MMRLRVYVGEDKRHGEQPLYEAIVLKARQLHMAGATVTRGTLGFGRSTRLHTTEVVFSQDLPVVVEIVDHPDKVRALLNLLREINEIGLTTCEHVEAWSPPLPAVRAPFG